MSATKTYEVKFNREKGELSGLPPELERFNNIIDPVEMKEQFKEEDNLQSFILFLKNQYDMEQQPLMRESEFTA